MLVCKQAEENFKALEKKHRQDILKEFLKILSALAGHLKIKLSKQESTTNKSVLVKAALLNLFNHSFDETEQFYHDPGEQDDWDQKLK